MNLTTEYLSLTLAHPFIMGASPLVDDLAQVRRLEDCGAAAIVMHSLFEEQLMREQLADSAHTEVHMESFAEAPDYLPEVADYTLGPEEYLEQLRRVKQTVSVPVIGSLNGTSAQGWLNYARQIEQAGADALELNLYSINSNASLDSTSLEAEQLQMIQQVKKAARIPVALKLSPFYTSLSHFIRQAHQSGADGFVIFNRFYQPDLDVEELDVLHKVQLSQAAELPLRIRWLAILSGQCSSSFAVTGGVHSVQDAVKAIMAGAHGVQLVSEILRHGPERFTNLRQGLAQWLRDHDYESVDQLRGCMNLVRCPDPAAYERAHYLRMLESWHGPALS